MFYLRNLKKFFKQSPIIVTTYLLMAVMTPVIMFNTNKAVSLVNKLGKEEFRSPFFHALIDKNENYSRVSRKLRSLPGVKNVEVLAPEKMEEEAGKILGSLDFNISSDLLDLGYAGIKVIFESNLKDKSMDLVREYLLRLVGEEYITLGELVKVDKSKTPSKLKTFVIGNLQWLIMGSVAVVWILFNMIFAKIFNNQMYLIQSFHRTRHIPLKLYAVLISVFALIPTILFSFFGNEIVPAAFVLLTLLLGMIPHLRKWQWIAR